MAFISIREFLGIQDHIADGEVRADLRKRISQYCKPCWELKYCPYGPIVENYPLPDLILQSLLDHQNYLKKCLSSGKFGDGKPLDETRRAYFEMMIAEFDPTKCVEKNDELELFMSCKIFGHFCPVFFSAEKATETAELRRRSRSIERSTMFRVARRDRNVCRQCGENVSDEDVEFDHVIPFSLGGDSDEDNVKLLCRTCNRKKKAKLDPKLFAEDPGGRLIDASGIADDEEILSDLRNFVESRKQKD